MNLENWFVIARSDQLGKKPIRRKILGKPFVLFRDSKKKPTCLEDRCPHKNVALSLGKVVGDTIECPYHGWKFDKQGSCVEQPCRGTQEKLLPIQVPQFPLVEQDGWLWVYLGQNPIIPPPSYPKDPQIHWFEEHNVMAASAELILENGFDSSHTGIAHEGLFRSRPQKEVTVQIKETSIGIEVETLGEEGGNSFDSRFMVGKKQKIHHIDTFIPPHSLRIDYATGRAKFITILICTPEDEKHCRVYTRVGFYFPPITLLVLPLVRILTKIVIAQDKKILENQALQIMNFGGRSFHSVVSDTPGNWMRRVYRNPSQGNVDAKTQKTKTVSFKL